MASGNLLPPARASLGLGFCDPCVTHWECGKTQHTTPLETLFLPQAHRWGWAFVTLVTLVTLVTRCDPLGMWEKQRQWPLETFFLLQGHRWGWAVVTLVTRCDPLGVWEKHVAGAAVLRIPSMIFYVWHQRNCTCFMHVVTSATSIFFVFVSFVTRCDSL